MAKRPNVVLVTIDALRADRLGCYGYSGANSQFLDQLAGEGALCEAFFCSAVPMHATFACLLSGQEPTKLELASNPSLSTLSFGTTPAPELFLQAGYTTCAFDNLRRQHPWHGRGYEFYIDPGLRHHRNATCQEMNARAIPWLRTNGGESFFLSVHYTDLQAAHQPAPYDQAVRSLDDSLRELITTLGDLRLAQNTLVVIAGVCGQSLTGNGIKGAKHGLTDEILRVPLIARWPESVLRKVRLPQMLQTCDVAPTLLEAAGLPVQSNMQGQSFWKLLTGEERSGGRDRVFSLECGKETAWSLRTRDSKFILSGSPDLGESRREFYNLTTDPGEQRNLIKDHAGAAAAMERELRLWISGGGDSDRATEKLPQAEEKSLSAEAALETMAREYLQAFEAKDLEQCMKYYTEGSIVVFGTQYQGLRGIEKWHKARFDADLRLQQLDRISVEGNKVLLEGLVTSKRLRAWRVNSIRGSVTASFDGAKIKELKFGVRTGG